MFNLLPLGKCNAPQSVHQLKLAQCAYRSPHTSVYRIFYTLFFCTYACVRYYLIMDILYKKNILTDMQGNEGLVREFIVEALKNSKVSASETYMKKEIVREKLQALVVEAVTSGEVQSQKELEDWWKTVEMATKALKMVPVMAWQSSGKK